jgi:hypothetical protein
MKGRLCIRLRRKANDAVLKKEGAMHRATAKYIAKAAKTVPFGPARGDFAKWPQHVVDPMYELPPYRSLTPVKTPVNSRPVNVT